MGKKGRRWKSWQRQRGSKTMLKRGNGRTGSVVVESKRPQKKAKNPNQSQKTISKLYGRQI